jgi:hypothetical protein
LHLQNSVPKTNMQITEDKQKRKVQDEIGRVLEN